MKHQPSIAMPAPPPGFLTRAAAGWTDFWFKPVDPTPLGFMRILCGAIMLYTTACYGLVLQDFLGPKAWYDLEMRHDQVKNRPFASSALSWNENPHQPPRNEAEHQYAQAYMDKFREAPPPPYPESKWQADYIDKFRAAYGFDLRFLGLPPPSSEKERLDLEDYTMRFHQAMPAYPDDEEEKADVIAYMKEFGIDPRRVYARGSPVWSIWMHVTDPTAMAVIHWLFVLVSAMFMCGLCTRITSVLTWFAALCYINRNPIALFGVDTMMNILLLYFVIGPAGAALSLDRLIGRWWSKARPRWLGGAPLPYDDQPRPRASANLAIRLIQIHLCIIYGMAGFSKLLGNAWWDGSAVWGTLANWEFAPMNWEIYNGLLRLLGGSRLVFEAFLTAGSYFTLVFEIGYPFLIWRPSLRWFWLAGAIVLHGVIGMFMGLMTFAFIMLVMNMAFLTPRETRWLLDLFSFDSKPTA